MSGQIVQRHGLVSDREPVLPNGQQRRHTADISTRQSRQQLRPVEQMPHDQRGAGAGPCGGVLRPGVDHVLVSPCGTAVVVLDTKAWRRSWPTRLTGGRVCCGAEDRHREVEKVAGYLEARAAGWDGPVWVLGPELLVPTLLAAPAGRSARRAAGVAARVDEVLRPYR